MLSVSAGKRLKLYVKTLQIRNFRNYDALTIELDPGTNIFYGSNAQGKTNILEAVYLAGTSRSHRRSKDRDMIRLGDEESHIRMEVIRHGHDYRIDMHLKQKRPKGIAIGGVPIRRAGDLFDIVSMVFFSPEDLNIIKNGPSERRRFIDSVLCGTDSLYLKQLANYNKCLMQRGKLLRDFSFGHIRPDELDVWDEQIVLFGSEIIEKRRQFTEELQEIASDIHSQLTGNREKLCLQYEPCTTAENFRDALKKKRDTDLKLKNTSVGPHKDDLCIMDKDMDLRTYGSQGQQRTAALSLKLAEIRLLEKHKGERPVLLLDDVLSELDSDRQKYLLNSIKDTQTLITCTGLDDFVENHFRADQTFHVVRGGVE
jgi:DNA replication and repair protein RecF